MLSKKRTIGIEIYAGGGKGDRKIVALEWGNRPE